MFIRNMKRGMIIQFFIVLIILMSSFASAGLVDDVLSRFSFGSFSLITGAATVGLSQVTGAATTEPATCESNEDCYGQYGLTNIPGYVRRCQRYDEYADRQYYINRGVNPDTYQCVCDKNEGKCKFRLQEDDKGNLLTFQYLRSCNTNDDCQGKKEKCVPGPPGDTRKYCKEPDCELPEHCEGKYPRREWNTGAIKYNRLCGQNQEFPLDCYCSRQYWCMVREPSDRCVDDNDCGIAEKCVNEKCERDEQYYQDLLEDARSNIEQNKVQKEQGSSNNGQGSSDSNTENVECSSSVDCDDDKVCRGDKCIALPGKESEADFLYKEVTDKLNELNSRLDALETAQVDTSSDEDSDSNQQSQALDNVDPNVNQNVGDETSPPDVNDEEINNEPGPSPVTNANVNANARYGVNSVKDAVRNSRYLNIFGRVVFNVPFTGKAVFAVPYFIQNMINSGDVKTVSNKAVVKKPAQNVQSKVAVSSKMAPEESGDANNQQSYHHTLEWYKTTGMPQLDDDMKDLEARLCGVAKDSEGVDLDGLVVYDGDNVCDGINQKSEAETITSQQRAVMAPKVGIFSRLSRRIFGI